VDNIPTNGPGKYDDICTVARERTDAQAAIVIIVNGVLGSGFSLQSEHPDLVVQLPDMLETMAKELREIITEEKADAVQK